MECGHVLSRVLLDFKLDGEMEKGRQERIWMKWVEDESMGLI